MACGVEFWNQECGLGLRQCSFWSFEWFRVYSVVRRGPRFGASNFFRFNRVLLNRYKQDPFSVFQDYRSCTMGGIYLEVHG